MSAVLRRLPLVVLSGLLLCAGTVSAQEKEAPKPDNKAAAKEHYNRGTSFYDLGKYDEAIKEFEAAYQLKNDPAFLYNLAQSYRQAGNHERAVHFYKTYLRYVPNAKNRDDIEDKIKTEEQLIAKGGGGTTPPPITTPPPTTTPPATTTPPTTTPPPGGDQPVVTTPPPTSTTPPPSLGAPNPYAPPAPPPAATDSGRKFRIAGLATAGGGAAMMLLGIWQYTRASSASDDIEAAARANQAFDPAVEDRGKSAETLQWVFYGLGTAAIAAGAGLWFYGQHVTANETTTWRVSLAPTLAPGRSTFGGATLRISF
jgi:tetratricopeptide (TPR) repeat protein